MEETAQVDNAPSRDKDLQFEDSIVFMNFLKALLHSCPAELSQLHSATDLKSLSEHPSISQYIALLTDDNFVPRWNKLFANCFTNWKFPPTSMVKKSNIIMNALSIRGDLLTKFNDFPAPPSKNECDMERFKNELFGLIKKNVNGYNDTQKQFIFRCIWTARANIALFNLQPQIDSDQEICPELELRSSSNDTISTDSIAEYTELINFGDYGSQQQAAANPSIDASSNTECHVTATESIATQTVEAELQPEASPRVSGEKRGADVTNPPASESVCKRPRLTPVPNDSTKFENFAETTKLLDALLRECSVELFKFKTTAELKKLIDHPAMEPFKGILNHKDFVLRWDELHDKCEYIAKAERNMATAAQEIRRTLLKRPCFIQHFSDFPAKPDGTIEDTTRYIDQLRAAMHKGAHLNSEQISYVKLCLQREKKKLQRLQLFRYYSDCTSTDC
uniref:Uncharacterized protein n=1 Tax=Panagrellus redivivus TaxID=6233 RepID=A0A7E4VWF8_PANRE